MGAVPGATTRRQQAPIEGGSRSGLAPPGRAWGCPGLSQPFPGLGLGPRHRPAPSAAREPLSCCKGCSLGRGRAGLHCRGAGLVVSAVGRGQDAWSGWGGSRASWDRLQGWEGLAWRWHPAVMGLEGPGQLLWGWRGQLSGLLPLPAAGHVRLLCLPPEASRPHSLVLCTPAPCLK